MTNLKRDIRNASKDDADKIEKMNKVADIAELIFHFSEENQVGEFLSPNQMLCRLPIFLAQLKAGNNSEKLNSKIRQLLYSLYL